MCITFFFYQNLPTLSHKPLFHLHWHEYFVLPPSMSCGVILESLCPSVRPSILFCSSIKVIFQRIFLKLCTRIHYHMPLCTCDFCWNILTTKKVIHFKDWGHVKGRKYNNFMSLSLLTVFYFSVCLYIA